MPRETGARVPEIAGMPLSVPRVAARKTRGLRKKKSLTYFRISTIIEI